MTPETIHLVFKTHLDIGFTDHAESVRRQYHERFIPQALSTAEHFHRECPEDPAFVWTTGAWLIHDHLATGSPAQVARLEAGIRAGLIRWHALPFTTHTELMSPALIRAGLSYSAELDARFGLTTRAAKMTDVPGHTLGMVPILAAAGVRFLHLGVNSASPVPDVPKIFRWRAPDGSEIVVMYDATYGGTHLPDGMTEGLTFAHTEDNLGPQSVAQTVIVRRDLQKRFPGTRLRASTLEDYGALLWKRRESLPVVTSEIGDSWIYGAASDPVKLARFRALQRLFDTFEDEGLTEARLAFGRGLCMVAEHTWGVDIKTYLRDETAWDRARFDAARTSDYRFTFSEASWAEQRAYLDSAISALGPSDRTRAERTLATLATPAPITGPASEGPIETGGWRVDFDPHTGDITALATPTGRIQRGRNGPLLRYRHASFDATDIDRHLNSYLVDRPDWAILDHAKPGLEHATTARSAETAASAARAHLVDGVIEIAATMDAAVHAEIGAPRQVRWRIAPTEDPDRLDVALLLDDKPANRMPEAGFATLSPEGATGWELRKTGVWVAEQDVVPHGGGGLAAVFGARCALVDKGCLELEPLDAALAGPVCDLMRFSSAQSSWDEGLRLTLYTNKWGTNFPMWWEGDLVSRLQLRLRG